MVVLNTGTGLIYPHTISTRTSPAAAVRFDSALYQPPTMRWHAEPAERSDHGDRHRARRVHPAASAPLELGTGIPSASNAKSHISGPKKINTRITRTKWHYPAHGGTTVAMAMQPRDQKEHG
jgi:hypothetical protein